MAGDAGCEKECMKVGGSLSTAGENRRQLLRGNHFQLGVGAVARFLVLPPPSKMCHVPEASALHMLISDFHHQLGSQRFPRQVLAVAPSALAAGHALHGFTL